MKKQLIIYIESKDAGGDDVCHTDVKTYKETLASIYFLEDEDGHDFHYCVYWGNGAWDDKLFKNELDAVRYVCKECGLMDNYKSLPLRYGYYCNSESGFIRFDGPIDLAKKRVIQIDQDHQVILLDGQEIGSYSWFEGNPINFAYEDESGEHIDDVAHDVSIIKQRLEAVFNGE